MERFIQWGVRRYIGGPGRSWLFTTLAVFGYRAIRSTMGRREVIDIGSVGKGQKIVIEHLPITHSEQLKEAKQAKRTARSDRRTTKKAKRSARRTWRVEAKQAETPD